MPPDKEKRVYPQMPIMHWAIIRRKFKQSVPSIVNSGYLNAIGIPKGSIGSTVLPTLKRAGLIDNDGKPLDRAYKFRDDSQYAEICNSILEDVYPDEIRAVAPQSDAERTEVKTWFANDTGAGDSAAMKMAAFYLMLLEGDPTKLTETPTSSKANVKTGNRQQKSQKKSSQSKPELSMPSESSKVNGNDDIGNNAKRSRPSIHLNIEIHISPDTSEEKIEKIFESMAKYLGEITD